jgi:hypothetical protein
MRYEIRGGMKLSVIEWAMVGIGAMLLPAYGIGLLVWAFAIAFHIRRAIVIDTEENSVITPFWTVPLSGIEEVHGEEIWTHSRKNGSSRANYITVVGDFGSKRIGFGNKDKAHEFGNRLKKAGASMGAIENQ